MSPRTGEFEPVLFRLPARYLRVSPDTVRSPKGQTCISFEGWLMNLTTLIVQLIGGALGGYAVGNASREMNLGTIGNAIVGALGGGVGVKSRISA